MAQTPVSASVEVLQGTTTLYTVPAGKTAVVKAVLGGSVVGGSPNYTVNKVSGGTSYPLAVSQQVNQVQATGGTTINNKNLLQAPVTLAAGESITVYTGTPNSIQFPNIASYTNTTGFTLYFTHIIYANSIFMAVGYDSINAFAVLTSSDGITWTKQNTSALFSPVTSVVYGGGYWVATPQDGYDYNKLYYSSDNGATWTKVTVSGGGNYYSSALAYGNSTWVVTFTDGYLYTASTPASWTANTAFTSYVSSASGVGYYNCIAWNGTYWFITGRYLGIVYTTDLTTYYSLGCINFGTYGGGGTPSGVSYSSAYSKFYAVNRSNANFANCVYSSTDGVSWERNTAPSYNYAFGLEVAGSNPVLLVSNYNTNNSTGSASPYIKSTDGSTWAVASDVRGYSGSLIGLSNGYFVKFQNNNNGVTYYITTDPTSSTGTLNAGSMTNFYNTNIGASNGTGYVLFGWNSSNNFIGTCGGTSGTNAQGVTYSGSYDTNSYGYPSAATYNPTDGLYYMITQFGYIFTTTAFNGTLTYLTQVYGATGNYSLFYFNGFLYLTTSSSSGTFYLWVAPSSNPSGFVSVTVGSSNYNYSFGSQPSNVSFSWARKFAASATKMISVNSLGYITTFSTTLPYTPTFYPYGCIQYQRLNNTDVFYGGASPAGNLYGIYQSSNAVTTSFTFSVTNAAFSGGTDQSNWNHNASLAYANSTYYAVDSNGTLFTGATIPSLASTAVSTSSPNGVVYVSLSGYTQLYTSGSSFYVLPAVSYSINNNGAMRIGYTNDINGAVNNSVMTGSIVEIS